MATNESTRNTVRSKPHSRVPRPLTIILVVLMGYGASGCGGLDAAWVFATMSTKDVTDREDLWGELRYAGEYRLKHNFFVVEQKLGWSKRPMLWRTSESPGGMKVSVTEYQRDPASYPQIRGVVESGTRVKCVKLLSFGAPGYGRSLFPFAEILDGSHQGKIIDVKDLCSWGDAHKGPRGILLPKLDYRVAEHVKVE